MSTVYRKTAKGIAEIETRAHRLAPRLRRALILVDGKKTNAELTPMLQADAAGTLASLLADGFIEVLATVAERDSVAVSSAAPSHEGASDAMAFDTLRREAARDLNLQLGPHAEIMCLRIERAKTMPELLPLLVQGAQMLLNLKGVAAAEAFAARFITEP